jgi:thiaminase/transcriptional activator TenA
MTVSDLLVRHEARWLGATQHSFLSAVRDGSIPEPRFHTWLAQDYLFVADLLWFQARLLARAPRHAQAVLAGGVSALVDELNWLEQHAAARGLDPDAAPLEATSDYRRLLERLDGAPFAEALTALWLLERAYLDAWSHAAPGAPAYRDFVAHWTAPEFAAYVDALQAAADESPDGAAFDEVVEAERRFWEMAYGA